MSKLTVVGSINADLIVHAERHPHPGETLLGSGGEILAGGKGANQAVAAAQLGANVAFVGAVGSDPYAEPAMHYMHSSGIDLSAVEQSDTTTGLAVITVSADGENTIVISPGANALVDAPFVTARQSTIADADVADGRVVKGVKFAEIRDAGDPVEAADFVEALRRRGIAVGPSETVDAGDPKSSLQT